MTLDLPTIADAIARVLPGPLRRLLRSEGGRRLIRFAPAAVLALFATQLTYFICQLAGVTAGIAGAAGWLAGAAVSYVVSRWAWERRGRPHVLKETLPFIAISVCVGLTLTSVSKLASYEARSLGLHGLDKVLFAQGLYLAANCVTFVVRFLIFHYVLFADRESPEEVPGSGDAADAGGSSGPAPFAMTPSGSSAQRSPAARPDPERRSRR